MIKRNKWILLVIGLLIAGYAIWFFSSIVIYILISAVLSIMGRPLLIVLDKIKIGKVKIPHTLSAIITLLVIYGFIGGFFALVLPLLVFQIQSLTSLNPVSLMNSIKEPLEWLNNFLINHQIMLPNESIESLITNKVMAFANITNATDIANKIVSLAGSLFIAIFAIGFITFFFLKQDRMLINGIMMLTPIRLQSEIKHIYLKVIRMLSKYFLGLCLDLFIVITLITISTWLFGFKNALMIGFFAGIMNIVPYVGPFIGWGIAMLFAITGIIDAGQTLNLFPVFLKISGILIVINLLDAFILQPTIYANVVKAHPLEIFLVILLAGSLAGIPGMILAIPAYTVIRIIAKEFLNQYPIVNRFTRHI